MDMVVIEGLTKAEAEDLLDWLEVNQCPYWELLLPSHEGPCPATDGCLSVKFQALSRPY